MAPPRKRDTYHHGDLRRAVLSATLELIEERGHDGFTLREVARRAGVSHAAPYRHYRDRDAVLSAAIVEGFNRLAAAIESEVQGITSPRKRLLAWGLAYVTFALDHPGLYGLMFGTSNQRHLEVGGPAGERLLGELAKVIVEGQRTGEVAELDAVQAGRVGWALVHGVAHLALNGQLLDGQRETMLEFARDAVGVYLAGLADDRDREGE